MKEAIEFANCASGISVKKIGTYAPLNVELKESLEKSLIEKI